jgi:ABC-type multidrug transport system ATPase subunit
LFGDKVGLECSYLTSILCTLHVLGKTTLLTLLSGKVDRSGGTLKVNGEEEELSSFRNVIGFVPQEDTMLRELTVEENVVHSAMMRLPSNWSKERKMERVDEILGSLEIDHIRDSIVGDERQRGISGGQRKRVNIAMEMVMNPS